MAADTQPSVLEPSGATTTITEERTETEDGPVAHIVKTKRNEDATAKVLAARIEGTPLEALCGHTWVPAATPSSCRSASAARTSTRCTAP